MCTPFHQSTSYQHSVCRFPPNLYPTSLIPYEHLAQYLPCHTCVLKTYSVLIQTRLHLVSWLEQPLSKCFNHKGKYEPCETMSYVTANHFEPWMQYAACFLPTRNLSIAVSFHRKQRERGAKTAGMGVLRAVFHIWLPLTPKSVWSLHLSPFNSLWVASLNW